MSSKTKRLKTALRRVFKVRSGRAHTKHVALVDSPGADTTDDSLPNTLTPVPSTHSIPNLDLLIQRRSGPVDADEMTIFSDKTGFSIKTEAPIDVKAGLAANNSQTDIDKLSPSQPKPYFKRSRSTSFAHNDEPVHTRRLSDDLPAVHSNEEKFSNSKIDSPEQEQMRNSPTGVTDLFPLPGGNISPTMPPSAQSPDVLDQNRNRSRSGSGETAATCQSKCVVPRHSHDPQKTNEAFLALKKELEKNEFTKAAQVLKQVQSQEGSVITASASVDSAGKTKQKKLQQHTDTYEIIPTSPSAESNPVSVHTEVFDNILGITQVSQSESLDSLCSDGSSYSSFDMEAIDDITIDSTTLRLIEMHKSYCENAKTNLYHPARVKKSNMRVASAYSSPIEMSLSDSSVKTEMDRRLTWYDEGENLNKPFTLKTDETFEDSASINSSARIFEGIHKGLKMVDQFLIPFTRHGLEKILGGLNLNCGGANQDELSIVSAQG